MIAVMSTNVVGRYIPRKTDAPQVETARPAIAPPITIKERSRRARGAGGERVQDGRTEGIGAEIRLTAFLVPETRARCLARCSATEREGAAAAAGLLDFFHPIFRLTVCLCVVQRGKGKGKGERERGRCCCCCCC